MRDGLQHIVDRRQIERLDRETLERRHEDHGGAHAQASHRAGDADAVEQRHGDVEHHEIGLQPLDQAQRRFAVAGGADQRAPRLPRAQHLQPLDRERLVIDDHRADGHGGISSPGG